MNKKKLLVLIVLFALLFVIMLPLVYSHPTSIAKGVCQEMRCDCYVPYQYVGGTLWRGVLDPFWYTCSNWERISDCVPYC